MNDKCAWCKVKSDSGRKVYIGDIEPNETFHCKDCGTWSDIGQTAIRINGMRETYNGAIRLMRRIIGDIEEVLQNFCGESLKELCEDYCDGENLKFSVYTADIVRDLFYPYCGGTSAENLKTILGIEEHEICFEIAQEETEE